MQTEAVFDNIADRIHEEISKAKSSIFIAVAWFTNKYLFHELVNKAKFGCTVSVLISNDNINSNSAIDFDLLTIDGSRVYKVGNGDTELMHNKFCVIDYDTIITGSYNWSYKAESNFENIIITYNDTSLAKQFISEFENIRRHYYPHIHLDQNTFPINIILTRLEIINNYILLEDTIGLEKEVSSLLSYNFNTDINDIIVSIKNQEYSTACRIIKNFISKNNKVLISLDPEICALNLELKCLEYQLNAIDNEKTELIKLISDFQHRHAIELGQLILEIYELRKVKFKSDYSKYIETEQDERQYREQLNVEQKVKVYELTNEERLKLKKMFRKATIFCHPDKVSEEFSEAAQNIFIELKKAYDTNDIIKVTRILDDLELGNFFKAKSETISKKEILKKTIFKLRDRIKFLEFEVESIKMNDSFKTLSIIGNWDEYFVTTKKQLLQEIQMLRND